MQVGWIVASLVELLVPAACGGCGAPGVAWCASCHGASGPPTVSLVPGGPMVVAAGRYRGPLRTALLSYKERGRRDLAVPLAALLAEPLARVLADVPTLAEIGPDRPVWLVPAPSRPAAARMRGGDHVLRMCRVLADREPRLRVVPALRLARRARDSVGLDVDQRRANLAGRLYLRTGVLPPTRAPVVLVDDVVTTGATVAACRSVLVAAGLPVAAVAVLCDATTAAGRRCDGGRADDLRSVATRRL